MRPLALADVAAISELFQKTFRNPNVPAPQSLTDYLQQLFLEHPRQDPEICSRVYVDADDHIAGFIGVLPLAMESKGRTLRAAVASSLMVDHPEHNPTAGARLLRSMLQGPAGSHYQRNCQPAVATHVGAARRADSHRLQHGVDADAAASSIRRDDGS